MGREKLARFVRILKERFSSAEVGSTSVLIAYYLLLSLFPLLIAVGNLLPLFHINVDSLMDYVATAVPTAVLPVLEPIVRSLLTQSSGGLLSISVIGAIWSASRGINHLQRGVNMAYGIPNTASFIAKKLVSLVTIVLILVLLVCFVLVFSFSDILLTSLGNVIPWAGTLNNLIHSWKWPVTLVFLLLMMVLVYRVTPDVQLRIRSVLPGALLATAGLMALVQLFSLYLQFFTRRFSSYGALGAFLVLMFWLHFSAILVLAGVVLNAAIGEYLYGPAKMHVGRVDSLIDKGTQGLVNWLKGLGKKKDGKKK